MRQRRAYGGLLLACLLLGVATLVSPRGAQAQPCLTCRAESCATKAGLRDWCGAGKDPMARRGKDPSAKHGRKEKLLDGITIDSAPPGASVSIDDGAVELPGVTPLRDVRLPPGMHTLRFSLEGHEGATLQADVVRRKQAFRAELKRLAGSSPAAPPPPLASAEPTAAPPKVAAPSAPAKVAADRTPALTSSAAAETQPSAITETQQPARSDLLNTGEQPTMKPPIYKRWWFWTVIGGAVVAGTLAGVLAAQPWAPAKPAEILDLRGRL